MTLLATTAPIEPVASGGVLVAAALAAIALIVVLITQLKVHPFLALVLGGLTMGIGSGREVPDVLASFTDGFGKTAAGVGILIALGAMFAKLLAESGGADQIVDTIVGRSSARTLPWAMAAVGALIGLPMFFEIGLVLLMQQSLVDTGIGTRLADWAQGSGVSVLLLAWILAVLIRLATGSATVATITASGLVVGLIDGLSAGETSLVVLAVGAGSVFFSHVNDAGFWLVKEYFGMDVVQTLKTWSLMETLLSVTGLVFVLALGVVI